MSLENIVFLHHMVVEGGWEGGRGKPDQVKSQIVDKMYDRLNL